MILIIVVIAAVLVEELELTVGGVSGFQHFRSIAAVLAGIHHRDILRLKDHTCRNIGGNAGSHRLITACLNQDNTVRAFRAIESRSITNYGHLLNIGRIQVRQNVIIESAVQQRTVVLLVDNHTIDDDERLSIHIERVQTLYEHDVTDARGTVSCHRIDLSTQLLLDFILDVDGIGIFEIGGRVVAEHIGLLTIVRRECGGIEYHFSLLLTLSHTYTNRIMVGSADEKGAGEQWNFQLIFTVVIGQHTETCYISLSTDNGTSKRLLGSTVEHLTLNRAGLILLLYC